MNAPWAVLWIMMLAGGEPEVGQTATSPAKEASALALHKVEIVIGGPEPSRHDMEDAIRSLLGSDSGVSWSAREMFPSDVSLSDPKIDGVTQIWIDVADASRVRIVVPLHEPEGERSVRTVDAPAPGEEGREPVLRETAAQIVSATVRALQGEGPPSSPRVLPLPPSSSAGTRDTVIRQRAAASPPAAEFGKTRPRRYSLVASGGIHSAPYGLADTNAALPSSQGILDSRLGPAISMSIRRAGKHAAFEARLAWETSQSSNDFKIGLDTQMYSATLAAFLTGDLGPVTFSLGAEAGVVLMRQVTSEWSCCSDYPRESLVLPGQLGTTWSTGPMFGPILQTSVHLGTLRRAFAQVDASVPVIVMRVNNSDGTSSWQPAGRVRVMMGLGYAF
jgi:hypothetical protein